jgi:hypothetical protein
MQIFHRDWGNKVSISLFWISRYNPTQAKNKISSFCNLVSSHLKKIVGHVKSDELWSFMENWIESFFFINK